MRVGQAERVSSSQTTFSIVRATGAKIRLGDEVTTIASTGTTLALRKLDSRRNGHVCRRC
jgi:hypothetical protein